MASISYRTNRERIINGILNSVRRDRTHGEVLAFYTTQGNPLPTPQGCHKTTLVADEPQMTFSEYLSEEWRDAKHMAGCCCRVCCDAQLVRIEQRGILHYNDPECAEGKLDTG